MPAPRRFSSEGEVLEQILLSWKRKRSQLNNVICSNINMLEQIHAPKLNHKVIQFKPDLL